MARGHGLAHWLTEWAGPGEVIQGDQIQLDVVSKVDGIKASWLEARGQPIEEWQQRFMLPIVKSDDPKTWELLKYTVAPGIMIRLQDYLAADGKKWKPELTHIKKIGGIRKIPGFDYQNLVLSSVAPDQMIHGLCPDKSNVTKYAQIINAMKAPYYLSGDGETYGDDIPTGEDELERMAIELEYTLKNCPDSKPIGLVNGSTIPHALRRIEEMISFGITLFAYYVGQSLRRNKPFDSLRARAFARAISKKVPWLMIIGGGSRRLFQGFNFANGFAVDSYWVAAYKGQYLQNRRWKRTRLNSEPTAEGMMNNLAGLYDIFAAHEAYPKLSNYLVRNEG